MTGNEDAETDPSVETSTKLDGLRRSRRNQRSQLYAEILDLRQAGLPPREIAPRIGISVRTVERWLAAGGEPEHRARHDHPILQDCYALARLSLPAGIRNCDGVPQLCNIDSDKCFPIICHGSSSCDEDRLGPPEQPSDAQCRASNLTGRGGHTVLRSISFRDGALAPPAVEPRRVCAVRRAV